MKILVLSYEVWNDKINGNNVTSNWFEGMEAEFANIYASPGEPYNNCCQKYYQITELGSTVLQLELARINRLYINSKGGCYHGNKENL